MKTAKEWVDDVESGPTDKRDPLEWVTAVQRDAWEQGMSRPTKERLAEIRDIDDF